MPYPLHILFNSHSVPVAIPFLQEEKLKAEKINLPKVTSLAKSHKRQELNTSDSSQGLPILSPIMLLLFPRKPPPISPTPLHQTCSCWGLPWPPIADSKRKPSVLISPDLSVVWQISPSGTSPPRVPSCLLVSPSHLLFRLLLLVQEGSRSRLLSFSNLVALIAICWRFHLYRQHGPLSWTP